MNPFLSLFVWTIGDAFTIGFIVLFALTYLICWLIDKFKQ